MTGFNQIYYLEEFHDGIPQKIGRKILNNFQLIVKNSEGIAHDESVPHHSFKSLLSLLILSLM